VFDSASGVCDKRTPVTLLEARRLFSDLHVVHVATARPDGSPHVIPLWFVWREEALYVSCRRESLTWRNVERDPRVTVSLTRGKNWRELTGLVLAGRAEPLVPEHPALRGVMSAWFEKYRRHLSGGGFREFAEEVEQPGMLRVRPERISFWDHAVPGSRRSVG
jgi:PPOX class probable F420-dependent enzyme